MFLFQWITRTDLIDVLALCTVCGEDRIPLAFTLLQIFRNLTKESHLLRTFNDLEIDKEGLWCSFYVIE